MTRIALMVGALATTLLLTGPAVAQTKGPHGEDATPAASLILTPDEEARIKAGGFTAGLAWHQSSDYTTAVNQGASDEFARLGITVVAQTDAGFDAARQKNDVETILAKKPSIILSLPVDPDTATAIYRPAVELGVVLGFVDNAPKEFVQGKDYATVVSDDLFQMGKRAGDAMCEALGRHGKVGSIFHDANFYVTNQRDQAFEATLKQDCPDVVLAARQPMADPARAEDIAQAIVTQHPDLDGIYVTWGEPAEAVLAALRNRGNTHTKIVTIDLSEPLALDMVKGGNVAAVVADEAYMIGQTLARATAVALLKKPLPPFLAVNALAVTKNTVKVGWQQSLHRDPPASLAAH